MSGTTTSLAVERRGAPVLRCAGHVVTTLTCAVLAPSPAGAFDNGPDTNLITDTIASAERRKEYDDSAKHGAGTVAGHQRGPGDPESFRYGNFYVSPELKSSAAFDDNIFRSGVDQRSDVRIEVIPSVRVRSSLPRHAMDLTIAGKLVNLIENPDQNYQDVGANFAGALHFDHAHTLAVNLLSELKHQEKGLVFTPRDAATPVPIFHNRAAVGLTRDAGRLYGTVSVSADSWDYQDVENIDGEPLDQDYRDTELLTAQLRVGYRFSPGFELVGKLKGLRQLNEGDETSSTQSTGLEATAGLQFQTNPLLRWHLMGGWGFRDFDREGIASIESSIVEGGIEWLPTERMTVKGTVTRAISAESTDDGIGTIQTEIAGSVDYDIFNNLVAHAGVSYTEAEFMSSSRQDTSYGATLSLDYHLSKNWLVTLGYEHETRDSTIDDNDMSRNRYTIGAKLRF